MVDFKEVKNVAALKADEATKADIDILSHQNINQSLSIGEKGVAQIDIKYQLDKTFIFPIPSGTVLTLQGYVSPDQVREWYLSNITSDKREVVKDQDAKS